MKKRISIIAIMVILAGIASFQSYQLVKAKQIVNQNKEQLVTEMAINSFKVQYGQVLDQIFVQGIEKADATVIYWTENVTANGSVTLHASAIIGGVVIDFPKTQDVTAYIRAGN